MRNFPVKYIYIILLLGSHRGQVVGMYVRGYGFFDYRVIFVFEDGRQVWSYITKQIKLLLLPKNHSRHFSIKM